ASADAVHNASTRTALIAGASGLIGRELLRQLAEDALYSEVHVLARRPLVQAQAMAQAKLHTLIAPLETLSLAPRVNDVYLALGTTIKQAGSQAAFRAVDLELMLRLARLAREAGAQRLAVVSALGADAHSRIFYNRVKGEMEAGIVALGFESLVLARPSILAGDRASLQQPARPAEALSLKLLGPIAHWLPAGWRPIAADVVARAMIRALRDAKPGVSVLESARLQELGA
ncbi:MAG TPA: NAD(P)H-binding protein, partial [Methylibium sp.]